jgi:hypothetical protein
MVNVNDSTSLFKNEDGNAPYTISGLVLNSTTSAPNKLEFKKITLTSPIATTKFQVQVPNPSLDYATSNNRLVYQDLVADIGQINDTDNNLQIFNKFKNANAALIDD